MKWKLPRFRRKPPPKAPPTLQERAQQVINHALDRIAYRREIQRYWQDLYVLRGWWPILLPALLWLGWRKYRHERRLAREFAAFRAQQQQQLAERSP
ncbi:MAG: hypothetical protein HC837_10030 [Chloroflexaceae bacterium]|nr:hypothetical protein [Chloroflexaceae bacterium]